MYIKFSINSQPLASAPHSDPESDRELLSEVKCSYRMAGAQLLVYRSVGWVGNSEYFCFEALIANARRGSVGKEGPGCENNHLPLRTHLQKKRTVLGHLMWKEQLRKRLRKSTQITPMQRAKSRNHRARFTYRNNSRANYLVQPHLLRVI
jgi:hypothetical protein